MQAQATPHSLVDAGLDRHQHGDLEGAERYYLEALSIAPEHADGLHLLGVVRHQQDAHDEAEDLVRRAIEQSSENAAYHANLCRILNAKEDRANAVEAGRRAVELDPDMSEAHHNLGRALELVARSEEAIGELRRALALDPECAGAWLYLSISLRTMGHIDEAREACRRALELDSDLLPAYYQLSTLDGIVDGDATIRRIHRVLDETEPSASDRIKLLFALGRSYERDEKFDPAYSCYVRGNELKRQSIDYRVTDDSALATRIVETFDAKLLARHSPSPGGTEHVPIFVVGMPRSGTTLVEQILASHPRVHGAGELEHLKRITDFVAKDLTGQPYPECVPHLSDRRLGELRDAYLDDVGSAAGPKRHVVDKMPINFQRIGMIALILPFAKVVHCRRDPVDTCASCFTTLFSTGQLFSYDLKELAQCYWSYDDVMRHWRKRLGAFVYELRYEALVRSPAPEVGRLLAFCGLEWDEACLHPESTRRPVHTASATQVRNPINDASIGRWRRYSPMMDALVRHLGIEPGPNEDVCR